MWRASKIARRIALASGAVLLLVQLVPAHRDNPPVVSEIDAPDDVRAVLQRACYDCHSNETRWPWYAYVAPVSWLVARDVAEGRDELNFSMWGTYPDEDRAAMWRAVLKYIDLGHMPPPGYKRMHPDAELSAPDRGLLRGYSARDS